MKFSNSMTLQVFHDLYKPCYILSKFKLLNTDTPLVWTLYMAPLVSVSMGLAVLAIWPGGALGYFLGGYVPPGTPNWHPVLEKISPKIDTPF